MFMSSAVKGFTLIELMMTLAVAAIILTIAIPSFTTFTQKSRLTKQVNLLAASIATARGEAAKRGARVVVCASDSPTATTPACSGTIDNWSNGWVVFIDSDNDLTVDAASDVVATFQTENGVSVMNDAAVTLVFNPDGSTTNADLLKFAICDSRGKDQGKELTVATTGRANFSDSAPATCTP